MSSFGSGIPVLGAETLPLRSYGATTWDANGRPTETPTTTTVDASVDPLTGQQLEKLPEQDRQRDPRMLISLTSLQTGDQDSQQRADEVQITTPAGTFWYEVQRIQDYRSVLNNYTYMVLRVREQPA